MNLSKTIALILLTAAPLLAGEKETHITVSCEVVPTAVVGLALKSQPGVAGTTATTGIPAGMPAATIVVDGALEKVAPYAVKQSVENGVRYATIEF